MKTYQGLRGLCTLWLLLAIIAGVILVAIGLVGATERANDSILYIVIGAVLIPLAFTIEKLISLLIDIAQGIQQLNERRSKTPPQLR